MSQEQSEKVTTTTTTIFQLSDFENLKEFCPGKRSIIYHAQCIKEAYEGPAAIKAYIKNDLNKGKLHAVKRESNIMQYLKSSNVKHMVGYKGCFEDEDKIYIIMDFCAGGDILSRIQSSRRLVPEVDLVNEVAIPILLCLRDMHKLGIIHRNINLENILADKSGDVVLGDFSLAIDTNQEKAVWHVGTPEYMAPEIFNLPTPNMVRLNEVNIKEIKAIDEKVDIWSLGIVLYELFIGKLPFVGDEIEILKDLVLNMKMREMPKQISEEFKNFINKMIVYDAKDRLSADELLKEEWITKNSNDSYDISAMEDKNVKIPSVISNEEETGNSKTKKTFSLKNTIKSIFQKKKKENKVINKVEEEEEMKIDE